MKKTETKRQRYERLRGQLDGEYSSFKSHHTELAEYILPRRIRAFTTDRNRGDKRHNSIVDATATLALRTLASGMMSGVTSPARPWFRLTTPNPTLAERGEIKSWLHTVGELMHTVMLRSNLYNALPTVYGDMGCFGTAALYIEEDFDAVIRCYPLPVGSYRLGLDDKLRVRVFFREFTMTVRQLVAKWGGGGAEPDWTKFSQAVRSAYENGTLEQPIEVCHVIEPNADYRDGALMAKYKKFSSCYYEKGSGDGGRGEDVFLNESGYDFFPVLAPRWETTGEDVYGTSCPGMIALGDVKALQLMQKRKSQAVDKSITPPMIVPASMKNSVISMLPAGISYETATGTGQGMRAAHEIRLDLGAIGNDIMQHQERLRRTFFEDLFLMLAQSDRRQITAREIDERHEEKLLAIGPVLEQLNQDLLDPLIDVLFDIMVRQGLVPDAPSDLAGMDLRVEYISMMAQAQKLIGIGSTERFMNNLMQVAPVVPDVMDKVDIDQWVDTYGEQLGVNPGVVRSDEAVAALRETKAKAIQAQQAAQSAAMQAKTVKDLGTTPTDGDTALTQLMNQAKSGSLTQGV